MWLNDGGGVKAYPALIEAKLASSRRRLVSQSVAWQPAQRILLGFSGGNGKSNLSDWMIYYLLFVFILCRLSLLSVCSTTTRCFCSPSEMCNKYNYYYFPPNIFKTWGMFGFYQQRIARTFFCLPNIHPGRLLLIFSLAGGEGEKQFN